MKKQTINDLVEILKQIESKRTVFYFKGTGGGEMKIIVEIKI